MDPETYSIESRIVKNSTLASFFVQFGWKMKELRPLLVFPLFTQQIAQNSGRSYKFDQNSENYPTISSTNDANCGTVNFFNNAIIHISAN